MEVSRLVPVFFPELSAVKLVARAENHPGYMSYYWSPEIKEGDKDPDNGCFNSLTTKKQKTKFSSDEPPH